MVQEAGMTDKQFDGFIRLLIDVVEDAKEEKDEEEKNKKLEKILRNLQSTLENS